MLYYNYRFYAPGLSRWTKRDGIGEEGGWNLYGFVTNLPLNLWDRLGLQLAQEEAIQNMIEENRKLRETSLSKKMGKTFPVNSVIIRNTEIQRNSGTFLISVEKLTNVDTGVFHYGIVPCPDSKNCCKLSKAKIVLDVDKYVFNKGTRILLQDVVVSYDLNKLQKLIKGYNRFVTFIDVGSGFLNNKANEFVEKITDPAENIGNLLDIITENIPGAITAQGIGDVTEVYSKDTERIVGYRNHKRVTQEYKELGKCIPCNIAAIIAKTHNSEAAKRVYDKFPIINFKK